MSPRWSPTRSADRCGLSGPGAPPPRLVPEQPAPMACGGRARYRARLRRPFFSMPYIPRRTNSVIRPTLARHGSDGGKAPTPRDDLETAFRAIRTVPEAGAHPKGRKEVEEPGGARLAHRPSGPTAVRRLPRCPWPAKNQRRRAVSAASLSGNRRALGGAAGAAACANMLKGPTFSRDGGHFDRLLHSISGLRPMAEASFQMENGLMLLRALIIENGRKPLAAIFGQKCATMLVFVPARC